LAEDDDALAGAGAAVIPDVGTLKVAPAGDLEGPDVGKVLRDAAFVFGIAEDCADCAAPSDESVASGPATVGCGATDAVAATTSCTAIGGVCAESGSSLPLAASAFGGSSEEEVSAGLPCELSTTLPAPFAGVGESFPGAV
jgi:hypothetical protein